MKKISNKKKNTQDTIHRTQKVNKLKGPSEDASVPLGREKKAITGDGGEGPGRESRWGGEAGNMIWHWVGEKD